jgi:DNA-binding winged helix-turn-helix (wHTH) protein
MIYRFSDCELDTEMYTLHRAGQRIPLCPKALHMLRVLLEVRHRVASKEELCAAVCPNQAITDATLSSTLRAVRQAVGDSGEAQRYIYTLPGYGYRFIAAVVQDDPALAGRVGTSVRLALEMPVTLPQLPPSLWWHGLRLPLPPPRAAS